MAHPVQITVDAHDPAAQAAFWALALGYVVQPPPPGFDTWEDFARAIGIPEREWDRLSAAVDPDGAGPRILFQKVPEAKTVKNRMHLDVNVAGELVGDIGASAGTGSGTGASAATGRGTGAGGVAPDARRARAREHAERLVEAGARHLREVDEPAGWCLVMADPEGNEFCVQ